MHPIFSSNRSLAAAGILWIVVSALAALLTTKLGLQLAVDTNLYWQAASLIFPWYFLLLFFCLSNFYLCLRLPLNETPALQLAVIHSVSAVATTGAWLALGYGWAALLKQSGLSGSVQMLSQTVTSHTLMGLILYSGWLLLHYTYLIASGEENNNSQLEQQLLVSEVELQAVKATIHPHFLYNSLSMLASMALVAPDKIHDVCVQMSEFLRYSVNYGHKSQVTYADEVTHIKNYLLVEQERFGDRLTFNLNVDESTLSMPTIPLLLFPLIENSIKHGIDSATEPGAIELTMQQRDDRVLISVVNSWDPAGKKNQTTGVGLSTLKKRIRGYYGSTAKLQTEASAPVYKVELDLPQQLRRLPA